MLYVDGGAGSGRQILPVGWISLAAEGGSRVCKNWNHDHLWWYPIDAGGDFVAYGYRGQNVYVNPQARVVMVKFSEEHQPDPLALFRGSAWALAGKAATAAEPSSAGILAGARARARH